MQLVRLLLQMDYKITVVDSNDGTKAGTIGGTILTIVYNIKVAEIEKTIVLASIGAVVSFTISLFLLTTCLLRSIVRLSNSMQISCSLNV